MVPLSATLQWAGKGLPLSVVWGRIAAVWLNIARLGTSCKMGRAYGGWCSGGACWHTELQARHKLQLESQLLIKSAELARKELELSSMVHELRSKEEPGGGLQVNLDIFYIVVVDMEGPRRAGGQVVSMV